MQIAPGDVITKSVSHQVKVGRDESWAKSEMAYVVKETDSPETIELEVEDHVLKQVLGLAVKTSNQMEAHK